MGTYIVLSKINTAGLRTLRTNPDRLNEVAREIEAMDGKVVDQWGDAWQVRLLLPRFRSGQCRDAPHRGRNSRTGPC